MNIVVTGARDWTDKEKVEEVFCLLLEKTGLKSNQIILIEGGADGLDHCANQVGRELGFKVISLPAQWSKYGRAAGPIRNREMLDKGPHLVLGFHPDLKKSKGTKNCVEQARKRNIPTLVIESSETALEKLLGATLEEVETLNT